MRAVTFDVSVPRYLLARSLGRVNDSALFGALSGVRLRDVPAPRIPADHWVELEVVLCGICGTDIGNLSYSASPAMEPFGSFPSVPGHEILARVISVGPAVTRVEAGQRVAVDPMISCVVRGYQDACPSCKAGSHSTCERAGEDAPLEVDGRELARGLTLGYHRDLPGGWGERLIAHESQLFPLPDELSDRVAVLIEPLSIGVHAALSSPPPSGEPVLVIGSGPIALGTIWALRMAGFTGEIIGQTKRSHEAELARLLGASSVVSPGAEARQVLVDTGARAYQPIVGPEVYAGGGFPLVFDCVGNAGSLSQAMRFTAPRGRIVMLGCAAEIPKLDLTFIWARELEIKGFVGYGAETWRGEARHTFEVTRDLMLDGGAPIERLVTHVFPLKQYRDALRAAANHRRSGAVKVVLQPT
jgi:threonine dehydrogenase-like Zn-dependent dehydrogenase